MSAPADAAQRRAVRAVARRYERDGYRVTTPGRGVDLPGFLKGFAPDLIAESERERVVIEVKRSDAVRGSNEIQAIAERVSLEPGWRFELVTVPPPKEPEATAAERDGLVESRARQAIDAGLTDLAFVYAWTACEALLDDVAARHGMRAGRTTPAEAARRLATYGVISGDLFEALQQARAVRNRLVHGGSGAPPSALDVEQLLELRRRLHGEAAAAPAG